MFFRDAGGVFWEWVLARLGIVSKVVESNYALADLALKWMLKAIKKYSHECLIINDVDAKIQKSRANIISANRKMCDGDVYNRIVEYVPFGELGIKVWWTTAGIGSRVNAIYELLFALRDGYIPDNTAKVY
jgi:hypothetical protein